MVNNTKSNMNFGFNFDFSDNENCGCDATFSSKKNDEKKVVENSSKPNICKQKFYTLIDGSGFIFRAFYAVKANMALPDGTPTNAVYGYCSMLLKLIEEKLRNNIPDEQEIISVIFDSARKNFRNDIYPEYKANRGDIPLELIPQFSLIRQATAAFGLPVIELNMYEADDIIATYVRQISAQNDACRIVSSDKDLMQLIDDDKNIFIYDAMKDKNLYACDAMKKFSVLPHQIPDVQALIGDTSDNIPGVLGIGPKGAADLINEFQNIENMYDNIDCVKSEKHRVMLTANKENALISKRLATLKNDIDMHINICDFSPTIIDFDSLIDFCKSMNFPSIVNRVLKLKNLQSIK